MIDQISLLNTGFASLACRGTDKSISVEGGIDTYTAELIIKHKVHLMIVSYPVSAVKIVICM